MDVLPFGKKGQVTLGGTRMVFRMMGPFETFTLLARLAKVDDADQEVIRSCLLSIGEKTLESGDLEGALIDRAIPEATAQQALAQIITEAHLKDPLELKAYLATLELTETVVEGVPTTHATYTLPTGREVTLRVLGGYEANPAMKKMAEAKEGGPDLLAGLDAVRKSLVRIDGEPVPPLKLLKAGIDVLVPATFDAQFLIEAFFSLHVASKEELTASRESFGFLD